MSRAQLHLREKIEASDNAANDYSLNLRLMIK